MLTAYLLGVLTTPAVLAAFAIFGSLHYREAWEQWSYGGFRRAWIVVARTVGVSLARDNLREVFPEQWRTHVDENRQRAHAWVRAPWVPWCLHPFVLGWTVRRLVTGDRG